MSLLDNFAQLVASYLLAGLSSALSNPNGLLVQGLKTELSNEYQQLLSELGSVTTEVQQLIADMEAIPNTLVNDLKNIIPFPLNPLIKEEK